MHSREALPATPEQRSLESKLRAHIAAEEYFERSGRTFRKGRLRLGFNRHIKPRILRAVFRVLGVYERGRRNALDVRVTRLNFAFPQLPPDLDGFEILFISDLHIDGMDGLAEALVPIIKPLRPDLCLLGGDYRWEITGSCGRIYPRLDTVLAAINARHGVMAILGNHDAAEIAFYLNARGVRMLVNDSVAMTHGRDAIWVAGTDDPFDYRAADLDAALSGTPDDQFRILLTHSPQLYKDAAQRGVDLYLCGHTHAGQMRVPFLGALKKNAPVPRQLVQGEWTHENMRGYTSWGTGSSTLPMRFNCPPEVTLIRLSRS